uniref:GTP-binding protein 1 n=1 Tax=Glossina austeni TaxID=7395 RepID=A0A1A9VJ01_GLOAU
MKAAIANSGKAGGGNNFSIGSPLNTEHFSNMQIQRTDYSSIRGKNVLVSPTEEQYDLLKKRLEERTQDSRGETIYEIGVGEDGGEHGLDEGEYQASVATMQSLATTLNADMVLLKQRKVEKGLTAQYLIRKRVDMSDFMEIRVAVVGNVDAGKSTLLGVLTHGELDNGRGHARQRLFRHKHEMESGRTSSVGNDILGFDSIGNVVNKPDHGTLDWVKICEKSAKVITFIDLAGHERYLKTTVFGMTGHAPDFGMLMIGANAGVVGTTKEHLGLALALSVPVFVVVTKIDMCPPNVLQDNLKLLFKILKSQGCRKVPVMVKTPDEVVLSATNFVSERLCPIFQVSNVTGENLDLLKMFLNLLTTRMSGQDDLPAEFQIDDTYSVPGVGTVVSGTCLQGLIKLNDVLMLGPDPLGNFMPIAVKSIHRKRMNVKEVRGGQTASFALKKIKRSQIRKGMVMVSPEIKPQACWEFEGEILVLHHPTTISSRYQAMVHCGSIRQTASIVTMSKECLRTGDKAHVKFRFIKHPEYIRPGQRMVFREGRTKAVGNVLKPITNSVAAQHRPKPNKMQARVQGQGSHAKQNQNQNPNVQAAANNMSNKSHNMDHDFSNKASKAEGVLELSADKRDMARNSGKRGHKRFAANTTAPNMESTGSTISQTNANSTHIAAKVQ